MNVGQLRKALAALPDDIPILLDAECENEVNLYLIPANRDRYGIVGGGHVSLNTEWVKNRLRRSREHYRSAYKRLGVRRRCRGHHARTAQTGN